MRANFVGSSVVSAITQTPASGPFALVTTPPMSSGSIATVAPLLCWAMAAENQAISTAAATSIDARGFTRGVMCASSRSRLAPTDSVLRSSQRRLPDRQLANANTACRVDGVGQRRRQRRHAGLAEAAERRVGADERGRDARRVGEMDHRVVAEVGLHDRPARDG